jgi:hypothetical protein
MSKAPAPGPAVRPFAFWAAYGASAFIAVIFLQSLYFKFGDSPETQYIFGTLESWATSLGWPGLFVKTGPFSQYAVGGAELVASLALALGLPHCDGLWRGKPLLAVIARLAGPTLSLGVISGAIVFHLFTPLGVEVRNEDGSLDGGQLFGLACGVWLASAFLLWLRRTDVCSVLSRLLAGLRSRS